MKHPIDPKVDCVFKAILGAEQNKNLLIHFLNAMLFDNLQRRIASVELLNPYNEKEFLSDKLSIVDVKARDEQGQFYQIEIQLAAYSCLPSRILYTWSDLYHQQLKSGEGYNILQSAYSVWLINGTLFAQDKQYHHHFTIQDKQGLILGNPGGITIIELPKLHIAQVANNQERWIQFFRKGNTLTDPKHLPGWMQTQEMEQAMTILEQFSEKELAYHQYQARQDYLHEQATIRGEAEKTIKAERAAKEKAIAAKEEAIAAKKEALAAKEVALAAKKKALAAREAERIAKEIALAKIKALEQQLAKKGGS